MTDILTRLAALTTADEGGLFPCPACGKHRIMETNLPQPGTDKITLSIAVAHYRLHCAYCKKFSAQGHIKRDAVAAWNSRPREAAMIALVQEATAEIERLEESLREAWAEAQGAQIRLEDAGL